MNTTDSHAIRLFVDFDGTVTDKDVGDGIFSKFMRTDAPEEDTHEALIRNWKAGYVSSKECLERECANVIATEQELRAELDSYELTPGFTETAAFCRDNHIPLAILSDGMDYYIEYILSRHGLGDVTYYANHMRFEQGRLICEFPWMEHGCGRCGNCKRHHMISHRKDGEHVIYAGDGYSDRFAIRSADAVFARRDLADFCDRARYEYRPLGDFHDVLAYLEDIYVNV